MHVPPCPTLTCQVKVTLLPRPSPHRTDFTGLEIGVGTPGKYRVVMDNSEWRFGGAGLIAHDADHFTQPEELNGRPCRMSVFSPARSAVVYANADVWGDDFWGYKGGQVGWNGNHN